MRFYEFADAEAQLGLLRVIIDNTWSAIAQQAAAQKKAAAARRQQTSPKPRPVKPKLSRKGTAKRSKKPAQPPRAKNPNPASAAAAPAPQRPTGPRKVLPHVQPIRAVSAAATAQPAGTNSSPPAA